VTACGIITRDNMKSSDKTRRQHKRFHRTGEIRGESVGKGEQKRNYKETGSRSTKIHAGQVVLLAPYDQTLFKNKGNFKGIGFEVI
jgi:hypothetical protein